MLGARVCVDGVWGDCIGAVVPGDRICGDRADNDCDGQPDDAPDATCECVPETSEPCGTHAGLDGVGTCKPGQRTCVADADGNTSHWGACTGSVGPTASDSCSIQGDDSNCDGTPNGGCECVEGVVVDCGPPKEVGICKFGKSTCVGSKNTACEGAVLPKTRNCASPLDNDCDTKPDNLVDNQCTCAVGTSEACGGDAATDGVGICRAGTRTCVVTNGGASSAFGPCEDAVEPAPRNCTSAADNNCDGRPDNQIDTTCTCVLDAVVACDTHPGKDNIGRCRAGQQVCVPGDDGTSSTVYSACLGSVAPLAADSCTVANDDSNCDGTPNGGCACVAGEGNGPCASPTASRCDATGACVACAANPDCAHLTGLGVCSAGVCVQCLTDLQCSAGSVCNLTTHSCEAGPTPPTETVE
jgi:Cys-rich repeat protein